MAPWVPARSATGHLHRVLCRIPVRLFGQDCGCERITKYEASAPAKVGVPVSLWVAELFISSATTRKITDKHHITAQEVRDAVVCVRGLSWRWDVHPDRGTRVVVVTTIRSRKCAVVLYPTGSPMRDAWNLGSVYFVGD